MLGLFVCAMCLRSADDSEFKPQTDEMRTFVERYSADLQAIHKSESTPRSKTERKDLDAFFTAWQQRLAAEPFDSFSQDAKIDYLLMRNQLQHERSMLDFEQKQISEIEPLVPFENTVAALADDLRRMHFVRASEAASVLHGIDQQVSELKKRLPGAQVTPYVANRAAGEVNRLRESLKDWFDFYNGYDPSFSWWAPETYKQLDKDLEEYAAQVREQKAGIKSGDTTTIVGNPIGRDALISELQYEMIAYTPEQLLELANKEFAWCEEQMKRASRDMGFGDDWHKALEKVKSDYVEPGKQPAAIRDLAIEAIDFVEKRDLVTIPQLAKDTWRMDMMTPKRQLINPFFTGGDVLSVSYPTAGMTYEQKLMSMRGNNLHFARATVFHELIPGHELQEFYAQRYRPWRQPFETPFYVEGWALYWEMLLWDMDFARSPEDKVGMLFWRMHRAARILFSLNFHLGKWTPQQCVDFLTDRVGHERENATAEVRRSFLGQDRPLYQAAYMLGGLQLRYLRKELVDSGKMSNREFHDAVLKENAIPIEMVRADLMHERLSREFTASWQFYGAIPKGSPALASAE